MDVRFDQLTSGDYLRFRREAGWDAPSEARAKLALTHSLLVATICDNGEPIAMARVIGDGAMNLYIQDVITAREHRGRGHATALLTAVIARLQRDYDPAVTIGLMAAVGQERLYAKFGFIARPDARFGAGMIAALGELSSAEAR